MQHIPFLSCPNTRLTTTAGHAATTKKKKKRTKKAKLPLTGATSAAATTGTNTEEANLTTDLPTLPLPLEIHTITDPTPENPPARTNGQKRPFPSDSEDPASSSAPKNKRRKKSKKKRNAQTIAGGETDGTASQSQSQSQSRDVSVVSTPQTLIQGLPGVETDAATGVSEKPRKWRKYNRKKKNTNSQPAADADT